MSIDPEITCGVSVVGRKPSRNLVVQEAMTRPSRPPIPASITLSTSSWPTMRPRLAPRARRTAISFCRAVARAISRLATLAQAISSTPATMPSSSHSGCDSCCRIGDRPCAAGKQIDLSLQELLARVRSGAAERRLQHLLLEDAVEEGLQRRLGLLEGDAGLQSAEDIDPAAAPVVDVVPVRRHLRLHHQRHADASARSRYRRRRIPACDTPMIGQRIVVDRDRLADDLRVGAEPVAPIVVAQHRNRAVASLFVVVRRDDAADRRADAEHLEIGAGHQLAGHALGLPVRRRRSSPPSGARTCPEKTVGRRRASGDRRLTRAERAPPIRHRRSCRGSPRTSERQHVAARVAAVVVPRAVEQHELVRVLHRQPPQQDFVDQREDRRVGADAQRDRQRARRR